MSVNIYQNGKLKNIAGTHADSALDATSTNAIQNRVVTQELTKLNNNLTGLEQDLNDLGSITKLAEQTTPSSGWTSDITLADSMKNYRYLFWATLEATGRYTNASFVPIGIVKLASVLIGNAYHNANTNYPAYIKYINDTTIQMSGSGRTIVVYGVK